MGLLCKVTAGQQEAGMLGRMYSQWSGQWLALTAQTELFGLLHGDLFFQGKLLLNDGNGKTEPMMCIKDIFCLIYSSAAGPGHYIFLAVCEESAFGAHWGITYGSCKTASAPEGHESVQHTSQQSYQQPGKFVSGTAAQNSCYWVHRQ